MKLFTTFKIDDMELKNRIVMAPMTRSRAINNIPNEIMAKYYSERADIGLIITEGVAPSPNGLGYPRIPGAFNNAQVEGWKKVTEAVHAKGGKIFMQIMHTGRISHPENMEKGSRVLAPSAIAAAGEMYTDTKGPQPHPTPEAMTLEDINSTISEYVDAAKNAISAGFDGIEIHGANGYLVEQFINPGSNQRNDEYGGSKENRVRFAIEVAKAISDSIGSKKTGIRLSPYGVYNDIKLFDGIEETYEYAATELGKLGLAYIHIVDHSYQGTPEVPQSLKDKIHKAFGGPIIASGGLDKEKAEAILQAGQAELTAFGQPILANPDFIYKIQNNLPLNKPDYSTFFTPGEKGYLDYPTSK